MYNKDFLTLPDHKLISIPGIKPAVGGRGFVVVGTGVVEVVVVGVVTFGFLVFFPAFIVEVFGRVSTLVGADVGVDGTTVVVVVVVVVLVVVVVEVVVVVVVVVEGTVVVVVEGMVVGEVVTGVITVDVTVGTREVTLTFGGRLGDGEGFGLGRGDVSGLRKS